MPCEDKMNGFDATEKKIADALKILMETKSFEKISISAITNFCSIHRQTFYYHFADKYELLDWICKKELIDPLTEDFSLDNMYDKLNAMFTTMQKNQSFYRSVLKINANVIFNYVSKLTVNQFTQTFHDIEKTYGITHNDVKENELLAEFFGYGISGVVLDWAAHGMKEMPQELTERIRHIVDACKRLAISRIK